MTAARAADPEGVPPQDAPDNGPVLDQRWIDEQTGRSEPPPRAPPPANKAMPPAVKSSTVRVPPQGGPGQNN
nr:hypothetical protein [Sphingopyxis sp. PET50]